MLAPNKTIETVSFQKVWENNIVITSPAMCRAFGAKTDECCPCHQYERSS